MAIGPVEPGSAGDARVSRLAFELDAAGSSFDAKTRLLQQHAESAGSDSERFAMLGEWFERLTPTERNDANRFFGIIDEAEQTRTRNMLFEMGFGTANDEERLAAFHKHAAGAQSEAERGRMFAAAMEHLEDGTRARVAKFLGGQVPEIDPRLEAAIMQRFQGRDVPAHELTMPEGREQPRGVVIAIHGGGWTGVGADKLRAMDGDTLRWNERGWAVLNIDYRAGSDSVEDVMDFHDAVRDWVGPNTRIGATGQSAGAHLALSIAQRRPDLDFAVSHAGPTDLTNLDEGTAWSAQLQDAVNGMWPTHVARVADSPALNAARMGAQLLLATGVDDQIVPVEQQERMRRAAPGRTQTIAMERGGIGFIHAGVSQAAIDALHSAEALLAWGALGYR